MKASTQVPFIRISSNSCIPLFMYIRVINLHYIKYLCI